MLYPELSRASNLQNIVNDAILLVIVTHSLPKDHPNSASYSGWRFVTAAKLSPSYTKLADPRTVTSALAEVDIPQLAPSGFAKQPTMLPSGN